MTPIKSENPGQYSNTGFLVWNGDPIPCLNICKGDLLNSVLYTIATTSCLALEPYDLSTLTLQGVLDILSEEEGTRTLTSVLQLLADGEIAIDSRLTTLQNQVDGLSTVTLTLDLKCFRLTDSFGNALPYTNQSVLQDLINEACTNKNTVSDVSGRLTTLQNQVNNLDIPTGEEPIISTCISTAKPTSTAVVELASNYCDYKTIVGDGLKIQQNISKIPTDILLNYVGVDGWTVAPSNMADFTGNLAIIINDFYSRLGSIEDNCCNVTCKDFLVGFEIIPSSDGLSIALRFTEAAGTDLPGAFTDKGSILTITDATGNILTYNVIITQGGTTSFMSILGLDASNVLNLTLTAKAGSSTLQCEKCISKLYSPISGCPVCSITGTGTTGSTTIVYQTNQTTAS